MTPRQRQLTRGTLRQILRGQRLELACFHCIRCFIILLCHKLYCTPHHTLLIKGKIYDPLFALHWYIYELVLLTGLLIKSYR